MAISIAASEWWDGNDGQWSSFVANIGTGPAQQQARLLPATSGSALWAVAPAGCPVLGGATTQQQCTETRGGIYDLTTSTTARNLSSSGGASTPLPFGAAAALGYSGTCAVASDEVSLSWSGSGKPTAALQGQTIASYSGNVPWVGQLGLSIAGPDITNSGTAQDSLLGTLFRQGNIGSASWAYTAGAPYKEPPVFGSLTLGGYDAMRGNIDNVLTVPLTSDPGSSSSASSSSSSSTRDLLVGINSIFITSASGPAQVAGGAYSAFLDSSIPDLWLPTAACQSFETTFGLTWNATANRYFVNETIHDRILAQNASITFLLGASADRDTANGTRITLPYAAFDLTATAPAMGLVGNATARYFPLRRATGGAGVTLGRVVLQEAYLVVNYNTSQFTLSPALFPTTSKTNLIPLPASSSPTSQTSALSTGTIAGIAIALVFLLAVAAGGYYFWRRKRAAQQQQQGTSGGGRHHRLPISAPTMGLSTLEAAEAEMRGIAFLRPAAAAAAAGGFLPKAFGGGGGPFDQKAELDATSVSTATTRQRERERRLMEGRYELASEDGSEATTVIAANGKQEVRVGLLEAHEEAPVPRSPQELDAAGGTDGGGEYARMQLMYQRPDLRGGVLQQGQFGQQFFPQYRDVHQQEPFRQEPQPPPQQQQQQQQPQHPQQPQPYRDHQPSSHPDPYQPHPMIATITGPEPGIDALISPASARTAPGGGAVSPEQQRRPGHLSMSSWGSNVSSNSGGEGRRGESLDFVSPLLSSSGSPPTATGFAAGWGRGRGVYEMPERRG